VDVACLRVSTARSFGAGAVAFVVVLGLVALDTAAELVVVLRAGALELADFTVAFFAALFGATRRCTVFFADTFFAATFRGAFFAATFFALRFAVADLAVGLRAEAFAVFRATFFLPALGLISLPSSGDRLRRHDVSASGE
jgi:hypothetical protein